MPDGSNVRATMQRAFSMLEIKSVEEKDGKRIFRGIATAATPDRLGDIVESKGAEFQLPIPLCWMHDSGDPIGWVTQAKVKNTEIEIVGEVANLDNDPVAPQWLKERMQAAWAYISSKLARGLSIGFRPIEEARINDTYSYRFIRWLWLELSVCVIPAHGDCSITGVKSVFKAAGLSGTRTKGAATGSSSGSPDASGRQSQSKGTAMKTLQELREERKLKSDRADELMALREAEDRRFTPDEAKEFDELTTAIAELDDDIRVKAYHEANARTATPARGKSMEEGSRNRGGLSFSRNADPEDKFKGQSFTRIAIAKAMSYISMKEGNYVPPAVIAEHRWGKTHPNLVNFIKAAVAGGGTGSGEWGAELAQADTKYNGDFVEYLYGITVFDRLPLRPVPASVHIKGQDGAATGYWVGESKAIPVSKPDFSDVELNPLKVGAISVCSKELIRRSDPSAELWIRDSLANAIAQRIDTTFLSAAAAVAGVSPAGILNGVSAIVPSGTDAAAVRADLMTLYAGFLSAKNASGLYQVMTPSMGKALALLVNALGQPEFVGLNSDGGKLLGDNVVTGDNVTPGAWILLKPSDIWKIGDGGIEVSMSDTATIEQDSAPTGASDTPTAATATIVSLWQTDSVGFKVTRSINWGKRRASAVAYLSDAEYGGVVS